MNAEQIDEQTRLDADGNLHRVRVMQHFHEVPGTMFDSFRSKWVKSDRLRFIVDDTYEIEQEKHDPDLIVVPGIGKLTRQH